MNHSKSKVYKAMGIKKKRSVMIKDYLRTIISNVNTVSECLENMTYIMRNTDWTLEEYTYAVYIVSGMLRGIV